MPRQPQHVSEEQVQDALANPTFDASMDRGRDARRVLLRLVVAVLGAVLVAAGIMAAVVAALHRPDWWPGLLAAVGVSVPAALLAIAPVAAGLFAGVQFVAYGYLAGMAIRLLVTLGGALAAVIVGHTPPGPTLLMTVPLYMVQLVAEAIVLANSYRQRN